MNKETTQTDFLCILNLKIYRGSVVKLYYETHDYKVVILGLTYRGARVEGRGQTVKNYPPDSQGGGGGHLKSSVSAPWPLDPKIPGRIKESIDVTDSFGYFFKEMSNKEFADKSEGR